MTAATLGTDKIALISVSYSGTGRGIPDRVTSSNSHEVREGYIEPCLLRNLDESIKSIRQNDSRCSTSVNAEYLVIDDS